MQPDSADAPLGTDGVGHNGKLSGNTQPKSAHSTETTEDLCDKTNTADSIGPPTVTVSVSGPSTMTSEEQSESRLPASPDLDTEAHSVAGMLEVDNNDGHSSAFAPSSSMDYELEVDEESDGEEADSIHALSTYPAVPLRYRVERLDAMTMNYSSRSLYVEDLDYVMENGRRYCGDYIYPNDELEQDRLRLVHQVFLQVFDDKLTSIDLEEPEYILDVGTGTGEWAIGMAEQYPDCEVVGVDISAIQPTAVPHNVFFEVDNCEIEWIRSEDRYDLVHMRNMADAFSDWDFVYREALTCLKPGGYLEVLDFRDHSVAGNEFLACFPPDSAVHAFAVALEEATTKAGRRRGTYHMDLDRLRSLGYVDVKMTERSIPFTPLDNSVAKLWLIACLHAVEAGSLRLLTKHLGWEAEQAFDICDRVCQEIKARALSATGASDLTISLQILTARKPTAEEAGLYGGVSTS